MGRERHFRRPRRVHVLRLIVRLASPAHSRPSEVSPSAGFDCATMHKFTRRTRYMAAGRCGSGGGSEEHEFEAWSIGGVAGVLEREARRVE